MAVPASGRHCTGERTPIIHALSLAGLGIFAEQQPQWPRHPWPTIALRLLLTRPRTQLKSFADMARSATHREIHIVSAGVQPKERDMNTDPIELDDLGDATQETKHYVPIPVFPDSLYFWGLVPDLG